MLKRPNNTIIVPVKGKNYVYAVTEKIYKKDRRYNVNKRVCVGKMIDDVFMVPNKSFSSMFPDLVDLPDTPSASDTLKVGTYIAVKKILKSLELDDLLDDIYGNDADMIKDIATYMIVSEDSVMQHFSSYEFEHPLFMERSVEDTTVCEMLKRHTVVEHDLFLSEWNDLHKNVEGIYISYDSTNMNSAATGIELLGHLVLQPVRLRGELVVVPAFLRREIVAFFHPLRLEPEEVDGHSHLTEVRGVAEDGPLVLTHVGAEGESVGPLGKNVGTSGDLRIKIQHGGHVGTRHQIEIGGAGRIVDVEPVGIGKTNVEVALSGGVVEHSPSARTHHERHGDFRMLIGSPHAQHLAPVLYVLAGGASAAIETLAVFHAEADDACGGGVSRLGHVALVLSVVVIAYYTVVFCHHEATELVDHGFGKRLDFRAATLVEYNLADDGITLGILQADDARRLVDDDAGRCRAHRKAAAFVFNLLPDSRPVGPDYAISVQQGFGELPVWADANAENVTFADFDSYGQTILKTYFVNRVRHYGQNCKKADDKCKRFLHI